VTVSVGCDVDHGGFAAGGEDLIGVVGGVAARSFGDGGCDRTSLLRSSGE
jgi:hypothetical protein